MKVLSLFNGISCGRLALERADIPVERYASFEIDKYANQIARFNYPVDEYGGDVKTADFTQYKGFDIVMGGFPCTDLSIAKKGRKGLKGEHSKLFWELVRAIRETECRYFLVENNLSMPKEDRAVITETLGVEPIMINSALVSAQTRKRLYWTNIKGVTQPEDKRILLRDILESGVVVREKSYCLDANYYRMAHNLNSSYGSEMHRQRVFEPVIYQRPHGFNKGGIKTDKSPTLTANGAWQDNNYICEPVRIGDIAGNKSKGQGGRVYSVMGKSVCLSANGGGGGAKTGLYYIDLPDGDYIIRKLTPVECERLQTVPDGYTAFGIDERGKRVMISATQRYRTLGNGWTVDVISHILRHTEVKAVSTP